MRLLNTSTHTLSEFIGEDVPQYAILSHTWGEEEVLYHDIINGTAETKTGYAKIEGCCRLAASNGFTWVWIDTCCINKESSAELSEAINSMYSWYKRAATCYVYLADVIDFHSQPQVSSGIKWSGWFRRTTVSFTQRGP